MVDMVAVFESNRKKFMTVGPSVKVENAVSRRVARAVLIKLSKSVWVIVPAGVTVTLDTSGAMVMVSVRKKFCVNRVLVIVVKESTVEVLVVVKDVTSTMMELVLVTVVLTETVPVLLLTTTEVEVTLVAAVLVLTVKSVARKVVAVIVDVEVKSEKL